MKTATLFTNTNTNNTFSTVKPNQTKPNQTKNIFSPFQSNGEKSTTMRYQHQKQLPTVHKPYIPKPPPKEATKTKTKKKIKKKTKKKIKKKTKIKKQTMEARRLDQYPIDLDLEIFDPYFLPQLEPEYKPIIIDIKKPHQEDNILIPKHTDNLITRLWIKEYELTQCTIRKARLVELIQSIRSVYKKNNPFFQK